MLFCKLLSNFTFCHIFLYPVTVGFSKRPAIFGPKEVLWIRGQVCLVFDHGISQIVWQRYELEFRFYDLWLANSRYAKFLKIIHFYASVTCSKMRKVTVKTHCPKFLQTEIFSVEWKLYFPRKYLVMYLHIELPL